MESIKIIICGPDRCGKSTLAKNLSGIYKVPIYFSTRSKDIMFEKDSQFNILKWAVWEEIRMVELLDLSIIFDRFFPCEFAYSQTFNRNTDIDLIFKYDEWWNKINGKIIFVSRSHQLEEDDVVPSEKFIDLKKYYRQYMDRSCCSCLYLNDESIESSIEKSKHFIKGN